MMMLLEIMNQQKYGNKLECQNQEFLIYQNQKIGGQLENFDLVELIQKFFIGYEIVIFHMIEVMLKQMKIIGWKYGIMYSWNIID
jgi:hypothetical protein